MKSSRIVFILILLLTFCIRLNVMADNDDIMRINPKWEDYNKLSEEEKLLYEVIPEKYIYKYIPKKDNNKKNDNILNNYNQKFFSLEGTEGLDDYFNLANYNNRRYVNSKLRNQQSLGLCWVFAALGSMESNILYNGVNGMDDAILKCTDDEPDSKYCKYKKDQEINDYYISNAIECENNGCLNNNGIVTKHTIDNAKFSERIIDYIRSKPADATAYNNSSNQTYTLINEKYNSYTNNSVIGSGGWFTGVASFFGYGVAPTRALEGSVWENYNVSHITRSLYDVYDSVDNIYQVTGSYNFPDYPSDEILRESWRTELKKMIKTYGSAFVATLGPSSSAAGSCYFNDTKKGIQLIDVTGDCGANGGHAMQIIGWDDNYEFSYCKATETKIYDDPEKGTSVSHFTSVEPLWKMHDKSNCETTKEDYLSSSETKDPYTRIRIGKWITGKGAWILKNSWGSNTTYPYLAYSSEIDAVNGVKDVSVSNYDNSYNSKNTIIKSKGITEEIDGVSTSSTLFTFYKNVNKEYVTRINFNANSYNFNYKIYLSNDGINYEYFPSPNEYVDYPGMFSVDIDNFEVSGDKFYLKIVGLKASSFQSSNVANVFTIDECTFNNNCDDTKKLYSKTSFEYYLEDTKEFQIITSSKNMISGTKIEYKIYNENNEDVSNQFTISDNYLINNSAKIKITTKDNLKIGKYFLYTIADNIETVSEFSIVKVQLLEPESLFLNSENIKMKYKIFPLIDSKKIKWTSSAEDVIKIDKNGNLSALDYGRSKITINIDNSEIEESIYLYVYKPIYDTDDFIDMLSSDNDRTQGYYLMNDLDFKNVDFSNYKFSDYFIGAFNGGNHIIKNVYMKDDSEARYVGLFNSLSGANIQNLKIIDSVFIGGDYVGSVAGYASNSVIKNVYSNSTVVSNFTAGGIIGSSDSSYVYESFNSGEVSVNSPNTFSYAGGIIGSISDSEIHNCYNEGNIFSHSSWKSGTKSFSGGIVGVDHRINNSYIFNSYNVGNIVSTISYEKNGIIIEEKSYSNGILVPFSMSNFDYNDIIENSYYLKDETHTINYSELEKSLVELKQQSTFENWDFEEVWQINENITTPSLKKINVDAEKVQLDLFSTTLNTNEVYEFGYKLEPYSTSGPINIKSEDNDIFEVSNNKLFPKNSGESDLIFEIGEKTFNFPLIIKDLISYDYNENLTNESINVNIHINYFKGEINENEYLKLIYKIGNNEYIKNFDKNSNINNYNFVVDSNNEVNLELYLCNEDCILLENKEFLIDNIDKERPVLNFITDTYSNTITINVSDIGVSGLSNNNEYKFAITNNNLLIPSTFTSFEPGELIRNIKLDNNSKYLWVKNITDKAGNKLVDEEYAIYEIDLDAIYYTISYYNHLNELVKEERIKENDVVIINYELKNYEDDEYYYLFDYWNGYTEGMIATEDINLYPIYKKELKELTSKLYKIKNGYIYNIKLNNINSTYSKKSFISNLENNKNYNFYDINNTLISDIEYIKTGLIYKNSLNKYILVLSGDVTGDGRVRMNDVMKIANHLVNKNVLGNEYLIAGDVTGDSNVKMNDIMKIASTLVNGGSL